MTEVDLEIQSLRRENNKLKKDYYKIEKEKMKIAKELDEVKNLRYLDQAEIIRLRRQVDSLMGTDEGCGK